MREERLVAKSKDSYPYGYGPFLINLIIAIAEIAGTALEVAREH